MIDTNEILEQHCAAIASTLEDICDTNFYWNIDTERGDSDSTDNYFDDIYGIQGIYDFVTHDIRGYRIMVTCGGPNIYVDTYHGIVEGYWGSDHCEYYLSNRVCENIENLLREWGYTLTMPGYM